MVSIYLASIRYFLVPVLTVLQLASCTSVQPPDDKWQQLAATRYAERLQGAITKNITSEKDPEGVPVAVVRVATAPDGLIVGTELIQPSAEPVWDAAVLRALARTERLPLDKRGDVPREIVFSFRRK